MTDLQPPFGQTLPNFLPLRSAAQKLLVEACKICVICLPSSIRAANAQKRKARAWKKFHESAHGLVEYQKPYRSPNQLVQKLRDQGLTIPHQKLAEKIIYSHNYFRFKAYFLPYLDSGKKFYLGSNFSTVYGLYIADQKIRDFIFPILSRLEIRVRASVDNVLTSETGDPFWHLKSEYFKNYEDVRRALDKAQGRFKTNNQEFALHYKKKYFTSVDFDYRLVPPFWVISEIFTLEHLHSVMNAINTDVFAESVGKNKLDTCGQDFGFNSFGSLVTNLSCIKEVRNICAHHSRLWNKNLKNPAGIAKKLSMRISNPNRLYSHIVMLRVMCKSQGINDGLCLFFLKMFDSHPTLRRDAKSMGFPDHWSQDPIWK